MHQSISAVPIPPGEGGGGGGGNRWEFAYIVCPGGVAFAILCSPGAGHLRTPG